MTEAQQNKQRDIESDNIHSLEQQPSTGMFIYIISHTILRSLRVSFRENQKPLIE